jgi:hypothetical protein
MWKQRYIYNTQYYRLSTNKQTKKLRGFSPRANYTDRVTAACRRIYSQLLPIDGYRVLSVADPYGRKLDFLDRRRYFFFQVVPQLYSRV